MPFGLLHNASEELLVRPLKVSGRANLRYSHVGINGIMNPAPSPITLFISENLMTIRVLAPRHSFPPGVGVSR